MSWIFRIFMAWPRLHNFYQRPYRCINEATRMNLHFFCSLSFLSVSLFLSSRQSARYLSLSLSPRLCLIHIGSVQSGTLLVIIMIHAPNGTKSIKPMCHCSPLTYSLPKENEKVKKGRQIRMLWCSVLTTELWTFSGVDHFVHFLFHRQFVTLNNVRRLSCTGKRSQKEWRVLFILSVWCFLYGLFYWHFSFAYFGLNLFLLAFRVLCVRPLLSQRAPFRIYDFVQRKKEEQNHNISRAHGAERNE